MAHLDPISRSLVRSTGGDWERGDNPTLESLILRLGTWRGSCFWDLSFGSTLHLLPQSKITSTLERDVEDRVRTALAPMVDAGELLGLAVTVRRAERNRAEMVVHALDAGRRPLTFTTFVAV